ncbi:hypothetical protein O6H91_14G081900 [Diphasiastrum complanatum]|uniref:Uncharacterized protein n=1 Tax=Diphasiastrum complanatum TaxID=34168 RepID=A0ACC2BR89_DIPCM|nr:hypothetical protein O6H91_14G081900 [Diphasiastrum complanatum]
MAEVEDVKSVAKISTVVMVIAMQAEALPLVESLKLIEDDTPPFPKGVPWLKYSGVRDGLQVHIVSPGKDDVLGVDNVGTVSGALLTYATIQALQPDLLINAGTAGGFKAKGASVGDVFVATEVAYHDRRIPIPILDKYGIGATQTISTPNLLAILELKNGKLSTGNSLDMSPEDEELIKSNDATIKDMEGAAVAYVAHLFSVPVILLKAVTDIIDGGRPTSEEFLENLSVAGNALLKIGIQVLDFVNGKYITEL